MEKINGAGTEEFPVLVIDGKSYTIRFTRRVLYRMGKENILFSPVPVAVGNGVFKTQMSWNQVVDLIFITSGWEGTKEDLIDSSLFDVRNKAVDALMTAWGKAFPAPQPTLPETPAPAPQEVVQ